MSVKKIAILFSGNGSNLENILEKIHNKIFNNIKIEVALAISNKNDAFGIKRAEKYKIKTLVIENEKFSSRQEFDKELVKNIQEHNVDLVVLAGFMRILSEVFTSQIKAINLHPSILPLFKGSNAIKQSFESDMMLGGVSVHFVNEELDSGKIIAQKSFEREDCMDLNQWEAKIHELEHEILPKSIIKILTKGEND